MSILPKNETKEANQTPRSFLIWGESMSGKTYLARQFPNPLIINTDGNGAKVDTPCIEVNNFIEFLKVIDALEKEPHNYETIIIDLIDDIQTMISNHVCKKLNIDHESDAPYGKGFGEVKSLWKKLMMALTQMKVNVIFISHYVEKTENNATVLYPSLPTSYLNMCQGRCDLVIQCRKVGSNYIRMVTARREQYTRELVQDKNTLEILETITGMFPKVPSTANTSNAPSNNSTNINVIGESKQTPSTASTTSTVTRKPPVRRTLKPKDTDLTAETELQEGPTEGLKELGNIAEPTKLTEQTENKKEDLKETEPKNEPKPPIIEEESTLIGGALAGRL